MRYLYLMKHLLAAFGVLYCSVTYAAKPPDWVDQEAAALFAKAALIEWSNATYPALERKWLTSTPVIDAREASDGQRFIQVVYPSDNGCYVVILILNTDNYIEVFARSATIETADEIVERFMLPSFDPLTLLEEG